VILTTLMIVSARGRVTAERLSSSLMHGTSGPVILPGVNAPSRSGVNHAEHRASNQKLPSRSGERVTGWAAALRRTGSVQRSR
jgi:hypothetical protein